MRKHFLLIFIIAALLPLTAMFFINKYQTDKMIEARSEKILDVGVIHINKELEEYIDDNVNLISKIGLINNNKPIDLNLIKKLFNVSIVEIVNQPTQESFGYYDVLKENGKDYLSATWITQLPGSKTKSLKITKKINFNGDILEGPYVLEIYLGNKVDTTKLVKIIRSPFLPDNYKITPGIPNDDNIEYQNIYLTNYNNEVVGTILIKTMVLTEQLRMKAIFRELGLLILLTSFILAFVVGHYIETSFVNPFLLISSALNQIKKGNLNYRIEEETGHNKIKETYSSFNEMVEELKENEQLRNSFISSLTHDLRTPLIAQERGLELLSKEFEKLSLNDQLTLAKSIENNNSHLLKMVNLILESYRFDSKSYKLNRETSNLKEIADECFEHLDILAKAKNIEMTNDISSEITALIDRSAFKRVFINLISNAIDNIPKKSKIMLNAKTDNKNITITVEDNGTGISKEDIPYLFDRYFTGKSDERKIGAGLGLFVTKEIVKLHRGTIKVESEEGKFTRFTIEIPIYS